MTDPEITRIETILKEEGFLLSLFDRKIDAWPISKFQDCVTWHVLDTERRYGKMDYNGKIPKRKKLTAEYIIEKINLAGKYKAINYSKLFADTIGIDLHGLGIYAASYGVGISVLFCRDRKKDIETISSFLKENDIIFKTEYSDAQWVYRFKISQTKENIEKLSLLGEA